MGWSDTYNLRDKDNFKINDVADALEAMQTGSGPLEYTDFSSTVSYACSGSMTISSISTTRAYYAQCGEMLHTWGRFTATLGGSASNVVYVYLPIEPHFYACGLAVVNNTYAYVIPDSGSRIKIYRDGASNYSTGALTTYYNLLSRS